MNRRLALALGALVMLPLGLLGWFGVRLAEQEGQAIRHRMADLVERRLFAIGQVVDNRLKTRSRDFLKLLEQGVPNVDQARSLAQRAPFVEQVFIVDSKGILRYPLEEASATERERRFLERTTQVWRARNRFWQHDAERPMASQMQKSRRLRAAHGYGFYTWFRDQGLHFLFWMRTPSGGAVGFEVERVRLIADVIAALPSTDSSAQDLGQIRVVLEDVRSRPLYQWGTFTPIEGVKPVARVALAAPVSGWTLSQYEPESAVERVLTGQSWRSQLSGLSAVGLALLCLALYLYREYTREIREAQQRMNFVNQVSHELKTPLTNIRMYAEMLEDQVEGDERATRHLRVVVSESQRLSRLIGNILTFARDKRKHLKLDARLAQMDGVLAGVIENFKPALAAKSVEIKFKSGAPQKALIDADVVEQILGNLLSNVEKYAAAGGVVNVASRQEGQQTTIYVADRGSGIPESLHERVFESFYRVSNKLTDGVAGTGIGLSIVRNLARLHGGDVRIVASKKGTCFEVTLETKLGEGI